MKVRYSSAAREDLRQMHRYLVEEFGSLVANKTVRQIVADISNLKAYPRLLRPLSDKIRRPTDYWYFLCGKYSIAITLLEAEMISVVRILDSRSDYAALVFGDRHGSA